MAISKQAALLTAAALLLMGMGPAPARADQLLRSPITASQITSALALSGVHVTNDQLESLSTVTAQSANPRLKLVKIEPLDGNTAKARMECEHTNICLPFYVVVHWQEADEAKTAVAKWQNAPEKSRRQPRLAELLVRSGKSATLVYEGQNLRMTLPVLCLQNGARGQHVRVISKDRKKVYLARVIGPGIVTSAVTN
jgi:Chaperone for flagella basal body P-ring formation